MSTRSQLDSIKSASSNDRDIMSEGIISGPLWYDPVSWVPTEIGDPRTGVSLILHGVLLCQLPKEGVGVQEGNVPHLHPGDNIMLGLYSADLVGSQGMPLTGNAVLSARQALVLIMSRLQSPTQVLVALNG